MSFPYASIAFASALLALGGACTETSPTCDNGACFYQGDASATFEDAGCPSGTVSVTTETNPVQSGCYASASCGTPVPSSVGPATWSAAQQACASSADSRIITTPCDGFVAFQSGFASGIADDASVVYAAAAIYDATTGALVAVIGAGPGSTYTCSYGEVSIPAACLAALTTPATSCAGFDAGVD